MYAQRRDTNEPEIIQAYQDIGAYVQQMDKVDGFDLLVCFHGQVYIVEVKNTKPGRTKEQLIQLLTDNELGVMQAMETVGVRYHIVTNEDEAIGILR